MLGAASALVADRFLDGRVERRLGGGDVRHVARESVVRAPVLTRAKRKPSFE